jgi:hypothetical protein
MSSSYSTTCSAAGVDGENQKPPPGPAQEEGEPKEELLLIGIGTPTESEPSADVASVQQSNTSDLGPESSSLSSSPKRPMEDHCTNAAEHAVVADFACKRQKAASTGESMIEKLKSETEQLIENPEETLGPDLVQPGEQGISTFHDNDVLSGMLL